MSLATECGLDSKEVERVLTDKEAYALDVRSDEQAARQMRVSGVPFFLFNLAVSGAQDAEELSAAIRQAFGE